MKLYGMLNNMEKVTVLMSTYNGELYIREQIQSILDQKNVSVNLIVRDDGSSDETCHILDEYKNKGYLTWYTGENLRPARSFMHLLSNAPDCCYFAFADQDDIWYENKLNRAVDEIKKVEEIQPDAKILYVCNKDVVDADGNLRYYSKYKFRQSAALAFLESHSSGCCMVLNKKLRDYVVSHQPSRWIMLHDYWVYLVANAVGYVMYDNEPMMGYRIHGNNAAGIDEVGMCTKIARLFSANGVKYHASEVAQELLSSCGKDMSHENYKLVERIQKSKDSLLSRLYMVFSSDYTIVGGNFKQKLYAKLKILQKKMV